MTKSLTAAPQAPSKSVGKRAGKTPAASQSHARAHPGSCASEAERADGTHIVCVAQGALSSLATRSLLSPSLALSRRSHTLRRWTLLLVGVNGPVSLKGGPPSPEASELTTNRSESCSAGACTCEWQETSMKRDGERTQSTVDTLRLYCPRRAQGGARTEMQSAAYAAMRLTHKPTGLPYSCPNPSACLECWQHGLHVREGRCLVAVDATCLVKGWLTCQAVQKFQRAVPSL